jgi:hypothetical protein
MPWEVLIIPLIGVAVWILAAIFRGLEDLMEKDRPARNPDDGARVPVPPRRRPVTDLDRFLDEARRRRESPPRRKAEAEEPPRPARTIESAVEVPPPAKPRERAAPRPRPASPPRPAAPQMEMPPVVVVTPAEPPPPLAPALPVEAPKPPPAPAAAVRQPSPGLARLREALKDRNALMTAIMLGEVLGRPACERRR